MAPHLRRHGDYIYGKNVALVPDEKIIQSWRTTGFADEEPDSVLEVPLQEANGATTVTLIHSNVPEKKYKRGGKIIIQDP